MTKFAFIYHGGGRPETEEEGRKVMAKWQAWMEGMAECLVDGGSPFGMSSTVHADGNVSDDGGANPASGYTLVNVDDKAAALALAKACPILESGGSVEVCEAIEM